MAFRSISTIKVGNLSPGRFAGGFIYGASYTVGGVSEPSKLSLSVVDEGPQSRKGKDDTIYDGLNKNLSRSKGGIVNKKSGEELSVRKGDEYEVQIGKEKSGIVMKMSLVGYTEEKTPEQHTMTFQFVDTSHILDRVFIGLPNRHQKAQAKESQYLLKDIEALCPNCFTGAADRKVKVNGLIAIRDAAMGSLAGDLSRSKKMEVNWQTNPTDSNDLRTKGGIITLGREEFIDHGSSSFHPLWKTKNTEKKEDHLGETTITYEETIHGEVPCDIPNVSYKFADLLSALKWGLGIELRGLKLSDGRDSNWEEVGFKNDYRQAYTGTLREVLNNWCADFGLGFVWDFPTGKEEGGRDQVISFVDLKVGVYDEFHTVKRIVETADLSTTKHSGDPVLINELSYSKNMMETYSHNYLSYYLKPKRAKTFNPFAYYTTNFYCLRVNDVFTAAACGIKDTDKGWEQFLISCALAKYDVRARKVYNAMIGRWHAIGITFIKHLSDSNAATGAIGEKEIVFGLLNNTDLAEVFEYYGVQSGPNARASAHLHVDAAIAYVDDDSNSEWEQFESAIADEFLGKHYIANPVADYGHFDMTEFEVCLPSLNYKQKVELTPSANKLFHASEVPWASLAARSPAAKRGANSLVSKWMNTSWVQNLYHMEIGAEWGTPQENVDWVMRGGEKSEGRGKDIETALGWYDSLAVNGVLYGNLRNYNNARSGYAPLGDMFSALNAAGNGYSHANADESYEIGQQSMVPQLFVFSKQYVEGSSVEEKNGVGGYVGLNFYVGPTKAFTVNEFVEKGKNIGVEASECSIRCETGLLETMCRCPSDQLIESSFRVGFDSDEGLLAPTAFIRFRSEPATRSGLIVFPVNSGVGGKRYSYKGFARRSNEVKAVLDGSKMVLGDDPKYNDGEFRTANSPLQNLPENTMSIRVTAQDVTNDADLTSDALFKDGSRRDDGVLDASPKMINVLVPDSNVNNGVEDEGKGGEKMTTLEEYHKSIKNHLTSSDQEHLRPTETLSFSMVGTNYNIGKGYPSSTNSEKLRYYLTPAKGMTSFNIAFGSNGLTSSFTFSTRPSKIPKQETTMRKIGPTVWKSWYR